MKKLLNTLLFIFPFLLGAQVDNLKVSIMNGPTIGWMTSNDALITTEGSILRGDSLPAGVVLGYGVNYFDFPFGFKLRTNEFGKFKFYAHLPEFVIGFKTKAKGSIDGAGVSSTKEKINKQVTFLTFGWAVGAGVEYKLSDEVALIGGLRFMQSIIDVTDDSGRFLDGKKENSKGTINSMDIRIGVSF